MEQEVAHAFKADPRKLCGKCQSEMHFCSDERYSSRTEKGKVIKGCMGRSVKHHPTEGDWWLCLWCDTQERIS